MRNTVHHIHDLNRKSAKNKDTFNFNPWIRFGQWDKKSDEQKRRECRKGQRKTAPESTPTLQSVRLPDSQDDSPCEFLQSGRNNSKERSEWIRKKAHSIWGLSKDRIIPSHWSYCTVNLHIDFQSAAFSMQSRTRQLCSCNPLKQDSKSRFLFRIFWLSLNERKGLRAKSPGMFNFNSWNCP